MVPLLGIDPKEFQKHASVLLTLLDHMLKVILYFVRICVSVIYGIVVI
jgi:hypothetical protein